MMDSECLFSSRAMWQRLEPRQLRPRAEMVGGRVRARARRGAVGCMVVGMMTCEERRLSGASKRMGERKGTCLCTFSVFRFGSPGWISWGSTYRII